MRRQRVPGSLSACERSLGSRLRIIIAIIEICRNFRSMIRLRLFSVLLMAFVAVKGMFTRMLQCFKHLRDIIL